MNVRTFIMTTMAVVLLLIPAAAQADTFYFDNYAGNGDYATPDNWYNGSYRDLPTTGDTAVIASGNTATLSDNTVSADVLYNLYVGYAPADDLPVYGNGNLIINDSTAQILANSFSVGYCSSATRGCSGTLTLADGVLSLNSASYIARGDTATSDASGIHGAFNQTGGTVNITGSGTSSAVTIANQANSHGTMTVTGDSVFTSTSTLYIGYHSDATGVVTLGTAGGTDTPSMTFGSTIRIGEGAFDGGAAGSGTLTVQGASTFTAPTMTLGGQTSSTGNGVANVYIKDNAKLSMTAANSSSYVGHYYGEATVTQTGGEAEFAYGLHLGYQKESEGTYNISAGKLTLSLESSTTPARSLSLAYPSTGKGTVNVSGTAEVNIKPRLYIAVAGEGYYNQSGGTTTVGNSVYIANSSSATGTLDVSGGSFDAGANIMYVGYAGAGYVNISKPTSAASSVNAGDVLVGGNTSTTAQGQIAQTGGDFTAAKLYVGKSGVGTYNLSGGNAFVAGETVIGDLASATGTMAQSGGVFTAGGNLTVGGLGSGTYNLSGGTANLNGNNVAGTGAFNFSGGTLNNAAAVSAAVTLQTGGSGAVIHQDAAYNTVLSGATGGDGGFTKTGSGTLTFTGTVAHTGTSVLAGGTTVLSGSVPMNTAMDNSKTDLQAGHLVIDYSDGTTGVAEAVNAILTASYNPTGSDHFAEANGAPIFSSNATDLIGLGWKDDTDNSQVVVMCSVYGDADLSGVVGGSDLTTVLLNYGNTGVWSTGDFDYSGMVGGSDLTAVLMNYGTSLPASLDVSSYHLDAKAINALSAAGINTVPEPSTLIMLAAGLAGLFAFALRKRK